MIQGCEDSSNKRKRDEYLETQDFLDNTPLSKTKCSKRSVELHLETPMPLEWQRCLDIKSGHIYYYNTITHKKISMDPRRSLEPPKIMSIDLELNLPCGSYNTPNKRHVADNFSKYKTKSTTSNKHRGGSGSVGATLEGEDEQQEMMTAVCKECHMLVIVFRISPSCPNCKFMHPPNQTPSSLLTKD